MSRERERERERLEYTFYNLIWKPITQYPLTLVDYQNWVTNWYKTWIIFVCFLFTYFESLRETCTWLEINRVTYPGNEIYCVSLWASDKYASMIPKICFYIWCSQIISGFITLIRINVITTVKQYLSYSVYLRMIDYSEDNNVPINLP